MKLGKPGRFALGLGGMLAALIIGAGCGPYQLPASQIRAYPPPVWSRPAASVQPWSLGSRHLGDVEERIWRFTNAVRRQYGLPAVAESGALSRVSQAYSDDMIVRHFFSHTNPDGQTAGERLKPFYSGPIYGWGENIWEGSNVSAANPDALARRIMDSWMSSSGHRQNILSPNYTHLGVGVAARGPEIRATQLFATLRR
ncbi:MAG: CAP domain-containing protein [Deltaproteobacteria bacterium]|nr:CAP domain-containing protein [Deltaproteobacteria bacterium]